MGCALNQDSVGSDENVNINVRAAFIHVLGDLIQSMGVFIAAITIYIRVSQRSEVTQGHLARSYGGLLHPKFQIICIIRRR